MAGDRYSDDVHERNEWQLDQIRQGIMLVAVVVAMTVVVGVVVALLAVAG